jgi:hypothetical protein
MFGVSFYSIYVVICLLNVSSCRRSIFVFKLCKILYYNQTLQTTDNYHIGQLGNAE